MDALKNIVGGGSSNKQAETTTDNSGGGLMGSVNSALGGGKSSEKNEDFLDKTVDFVQEKTGGGPQDNESAFEQAKDEQISDFIRGQYKGTTGKEFPVADK